MSRQTGHSMYFKKSVCEFAILNLQKRKIVSFQKKYIENLDSSYRYVCYGRSGESMPLSIVKDIIAKNCISSVFIGIPKGGRRG